MYWQRVKRTILARFTLFFLRNPYPELALIRTDNAAKSFYALSHIYALRIEMVDAIFVQTKHKYFLSAKFGFYWRIFNTACMGCLP